MKALNLDELAAEIVRRIRLVSDPERVIIFGSHARGNAGPDSDVDLLVVTASAEPRREQTFRLRRALRGLGVPIDVLVVTPEILVRYANNPYTIYESALREGMVIYERQAA